MSLPASSSALRTPPGPLRLRRLALGLRQSDVAELAGLSREQIVRLEGGSCIPRLDTAQRLAAVLGCDPAIIFPVNDERPGRDTEALIKIRPDQGRHGEGYRPG